MSSSRRAVGGTRGLRRAAIAIAIVLASALLLLRVVPRLLPYAGQKRLDSIEFSRVVLDSKGGELQVLPLEKGLRRVYVGWKEIPRSLVRVILGAEDKRFWFHPGVDPIGLARAIVQNRRAGATVSGASTISMQLARIITPRPRTVRSKIIEAWEALQLESRLGKRGVLTLYVDLLPFGQNAEGFATASRVFFGKPLNELSREELMILAVMPRSPEEYNPYSGAASNRAAVMRLAGACGIPDTPLFEKRLAAAYRAVRDPSRPDIWPFRAPQFVEFLKTRPEWKRWDTRKPFPTTIEPGLQRYVESLLAQEVAKAAPKRITNGAALFVRPWDMTVAAYVGSVDFSDIAHSGQIDGVQIQRQPGSTLKPFLYSLALEHGFTASTILPDIPTDFGGGEVYVPANFNNQFNGPVRLRQALASSLNVPAVYTLERIGVLPFTDFLIADGFRSLAPQRGQLGLGLTLGNAEVKLWELVQAYGIFLTEGKPVHLRVMEDASTRRAADRAAAEATAQAADDGVGASAAAGTSRPTQPAALQAEAPAAISVPGSGSELAAAGPNRKAARPMSRAGRSAVQLLDPRVTRIIRDILTRYPDRTLTFGRDGNTRLKFEGAIKTGTSSQFNNIWAVGFTPDLLGGIWMGNFSGDTVIGAPGSGIPAGVLAKVLEDFSTHPAFPPMTGLVKKRICTLSGELATGNCPHTMDEWYIPGTEPGYCTWHVAGPSGVEVRYPQKYQSWLVRYRYRDPHDFLSGPVQILRPLDGSVFYWEPGLPPGSQAVHIESVGRGVGTLEVDGRIVARGDFPLSADWPLERGEHQITLTAAGSTSEVGFTVR